MIKTRITNLTDFALRVNYLATTRTLLPPRQAIVIRGDINQMLSRKPRRLAALNNEIAEGRIKVELVEEPNDPVVARLEKSQAEAQKAKVEPEQTPPAEEKPRQEKVVNKEKTAKGDNTAGEVAKTSDAKAKTDDKATDKIAKPKGSKSGKSQSSTKASKAQSKKTPAREEKKNSDADTKAG